MPLCVCVFVCVCAFPKTQRKSVVEKELVPEGGTLTMQSNEQISVSSFVDFFEGSSKHQLVKGACVR